MFRRTFLNRVFSGTTTALTVATNYAHSGGDRLDLLDTRIMPEMYGAIADGATDCTAALQMAIDTGLIIVLGAGRYRVSSLDFSALREMRGAGRDRSIIEFTTTNRHAAVFGQDHSKKLATTHRVRGVQFKYSGTGQLSGKHGIYATSKLIFDEVYVTGFTNDGLHFATVDTNTEAPYFCEVRNSWFKKNGVDGCAVRDNANANMFINCQFDSNGRYGFHHYVDSVGGSRATYGTIILGGQASYNGNRGWQFASGTNLTATGLYAEYNCTELAPSIYRNASNYAPGDLIKLSLNMGSKGQSSVIYRAVREFTSVDWDADFVAGNWKSYGSNVFVGSNVTFSTIKVGTVQSNKTDTIRVEHASANTQVYYGGLPISVRYPELEIYVPARGEGSMIFHEGLNDMFRIRYDGKRGYPNNRLIIESKGGDGWKEIITMNNNTSLGFFGSKPVRQGSRIPLPNGGLTVDDEARRAIAALISRLHDIGLTEP